MAEIPGPRFWKTFDQLPADVQEAAYDKFELYLKDPRHASLRRKALPQYGENVFEIYVKYHYRAIGETLPSGDTLWHAIRSKEGIASYLKGRKRSR